MGLLYPPEVANPFNLKLLAQRELSTALLVCLEEIMLSHSLFLKKRI